MEQIAEVIETLDNLVHGLQMPIPDDIHVQALREALPELHAKLKKGYLEAGGEDHWG